MTDKDILIEAARSSVRLGLNSGTAGNFSLRQQGGLLITPTGILPDAMQTAQIVAIGLDGAWQGDWRPSSEWAIHAAIYVARPDVGAVVHAHPDHCVALSCLRLPIPAFHYMVAALGGSQVPCAPYARFGSSALADAVVQTLGSGLHACLMANHGMVATGPDMATALARAARVEMLARHYLLARASGDPVLLTAAEMEDVAAGYTTYGQQKP
jgi:L-fuculose-phosphate aldolase